MQDKIIALTFDDGPNTVTTPRVLDDLEKDGAAGTFFLVGSNINELSAQARDGAVILLHDMEGNEQTVQALDMIIPALKEQGYRFVTISQLFEQSGVTPDAESFIVYSYTKQTTAYA